MTGRRGIVVRAYGGTDVLAETELPELLPRPGQVVIRSHACGLNYSDVLMRRGEYPRGPVPPFVSGIEGAGIVESAAPGASWVPGDRVMFVVPTGAHATHVVADAAACARVPDWMSFPDAAAFPVSWLTAYFALTTFARARAGERVLVHAASGALGGAAVQIARRLGLTVLATASTEAKRERARSLGADRALAYSELSPELAPDIVLQTVGGAVYRTSLNILRPGGRMVLIGFAGEPPAPLDPVRLLMRSQTVAGFHLGSMLDDTAALREATDRLFAWIGEGALTIDVGHRLALSAIADAHGLIEQRTSAGKVVLIPDD